MTNVSFAPGSWIFRPGDPGDRAFLVRKGEVELLTEANDIPLRIATFGEGEVFGEMSLVEERPRSLAARAVGEVSATALTRDDFERLLTSDPAHARHYLRSLFERLRTLSSRLAELSAASPIAEDVPMAEAVPDVHAPVAFPIAPGKSTSANAPTVVVHPLTRKAAETLPDDGLMLTTFPLRIGRAPAANEPDTFDLNDLWLLDEKPYSISRNHCEIALDDQNRVMVRDRGSHLGCVVNEKPIGGRAAYGYTRLHPGENVLILGGRVSPYQFRVTVG